MGKQLVPCVKSCFKLLREHSVITFSVCFLALLYRSCPFLFHILIRSCPVLIGTALLLGCLLSYGELELEAGSASATHEKKEEDCHGDSSQKANALVSEAQSETTFVAKSWREYVPLTNQYDNPLLEVHNHDEDAQEEDSDSESIIREATLPKATTENIDELHPLLQSDLIHTQIEEEEEEEEEELSEDHEDEEEANKEEDESNSAIKWTADDEKNLMDLGYLELERNQRLETLLLRRRARSSIKTIDERNLIDFEGTDSQNFLSISTKRQNPFDLPIDLMDDAPGSAPSVLHPRNNPFDRLSKQSIEIPASQSLYSRHASFHVGSSFWEFPRHFAPEMCEVKENDSEIDVEHEVEEYPSNLVKHGSISSEDGELQETKVDKQSSVSETSSRSVPDMDIQDFRKSNDESFEENPTAKTKIFFDEQQRTLAIDNFGVPGTYPRSPSDSGYQELSTNIFEENQREKDDNSPFPGTSRHSVSDKGNEEVEEVNELFKQQSGATVDSERQNMYDRYASETSSRSGSDSEKDEEYCFEEQKSSAAIEDDWHKDSAPVSGTSSSSSSDPETRGLMIPMDYETQNKSSLSGTSSSSGSDTENEDEKHCCEEQTGGMDYETLNNDNAYDSGTSSPSVPDLGNEEEKHCVVEEQSKVAMDCVPAFSDVRHLPGTSPVSDTDSQKSETSIESSNEEVIPVDSESLSRDLQNKEVNEFEKKVDCESPSNRVAGTSSSCVSATENLKPMDSETPSVGDVGKQEVNVAVDDGPQIKDPVYDSSPSSKDQIVNVEEPEVSLSVDDEKVKDVCHVATMRSENIEE